MNDPKLVVDKTFKYKVILTLLFFILMFGVIITKSIFLQIIDRDKLISYSNDQSLRSITIYPNRGQIYDRNHDPLALNVETYNIFVFPKFLDKKKSDLLRLSRILSNRTLVDLKNKLKGREKFTFLAKKIKLTSSQIGEIQKLKSIGLEQTPKRVYPNGRLASQILGAVSSDNSGSAGAEYMFDEILKGDPQKITYVKDAKGRPIKFHKSSKKKSAYDIVLTIDKNIQAKAEFFLKEGIDLHKASSGGIGVMDATNGEILAMANYPSFDPNIDPSLDDLKYRRLSFITDPIEPGSIFKLFTTASALENKVVRPSTNYYCELGKMQVENHIIKEADSFKGHEWLSVSEIIKESSNIGTTKMAFDLTFPKLKKSLEKYGVGVKTGIRLPGESRGIFTDEENVSPLVLSNISFGQGVATNGLQIMSFYSAIANGGMYYPPKIIRNGESIGIKEKRETKRILDEKTASELKEMLIMAVEEGTGKNAKINYLKIAGKTSTAQKLSNAKRYEEYISGFIGAITNIESPLVIYVYVEEPSAGSIYGGEVAAPIFKKLASYITLKRKNNNDLILANKDAFNGIDSVHIKQSNILKVTRGIIPNFAGLDKISAQKLAKKAGLFIKSSGIGLVREQGPPAGEKSREGDEVKLIFRPPQYD